MRLFDTHAHIGDAAFDGDRDALVCALPEKGVSLITEVCCDTADWERTAELIHKYPFVYAALGMHPHEAGHTENKDIDYIKSLFEKEPKLKAWGEIGLDYHYDFAPREVQRRWFAEQLDAAAALNVPVVLHIREAFGDCMDILRARRGRGLRGEMHCFSGSPEIAKECLDLGLYIAFGGAVTFKNANKLLDAAKSVPRDRLLLETDCPYMTPVPHRGERNDPSLMHYTLSRLAEIRGEDETELAETAYQNGRAMFGI